jgi:hypothetical protein
MKTLITGMTAPQASKKYAERSVSFAGLLSSALSTKLHSSEICAPSFGMTRDALEDYDLVFVGLSPLTSVAANHAYAALWVINEMRDSPKLRLFLDAPDPGKIAHSIHAMQESPAAMFKPFYSARPFYAQARTPETAAKIHGAVNYLNSYTWAETLYPILPWGNQGKVASALPPHAVNSLRAVNLDSLIFDRVHDVETFSSSDGSRFWVVDDVKSRWAASVQATMKTNVVPMKEHKGWADRDVLAQMSQGVGALIAPSKPTGSWWTPRVAQSIGVGVPVVTDWRESAILGDPWMDLAVTVDEMNQARRDSLAAQQKDSYLSSITPKGKALEYLLDTLLLSSK